MISRGGTAKARARASICCSPPERLPARCVRRWPRTGKSPMARSMALARSPRFPGPRPCAGCRSPRGPERCPPLRDVGETQLADAVGRLAGYDLAVEGDPPAAAGTSPDTVRASVLLPAPLAPRTAVTEPAATSRDTSKNAWEAHSGHRGSRRPRGVRHWLTSTRASPCVSSSPR